MFLKDLLFPKICLGCGSLGSYVCLKCRDKLSYLRFDICVYCQRPSLYGLSHPSCVKKHQLDGLISIFHYNDFLKKIIKNIKYRLATEIWREFYKAIRPQTVVKINFYKTVNLDFELVPIPLHFARLKQRGFNQADSIAGYFGNLLDFPVNSLLVRKKETASQAMIKNNKSRKFNIIGAFDVFDIKSVANNSYILVDDVFTSGSTIKEAAKTLKTRGAKKVFALTLARG